jgi:hypothetical protein
MNGATDGANDDMGADQDGACLGALWSKDRGLDGAALRSMSGARSEAGYRGGTSARR